MKHKLAFFASVLSLTLAAAPEASAQWQQAQQPYLNPIVKCMTANGNFCFAGTDQGVLVSSDYGSHWDSANTGLTELDIHAMTSEGNIVYAGSWGGGVFQSSDNGAHWQPVNAGLLNLYIAALAVAGTNLFAGTYGDGAFVSTIGANAWQEANNGLQDIYVFAFAVNNAGVFAGTYDHGIFFTSDNGTTWSADNNGLSDLYLHVFCVSGSDVYAGTFQDGVFRSTDNGQGPWTPENIGLTAVNIGAFSNDGNDILVGDDSGGVSFSTDQGSTWNQLSYGLTDLNVLSLIVQGGNILAGTDGGIFLIPPPADTQAIPLQKDTSLTVSGDSTSARAHRIDFVNHSNASLTILSAALTDSNNRFSVSQLLPGVPDTVPPGAMFSMIVNFTGDTLGTVYPDTIVLTIDPNQLVSSYYVYLKGNSFSTAPLGVAQNSPAASADLRIYPNPLSTSGSILYSLPSESSVSITIYDALGRVVASPVVGEMESAGQHETTFDTQDLSPGVYSCRLSAGDAEMMARVVVVR